MVSKRFFDPQNIARLNYHWHERKLSIIILFAAALLVTWLGIVSL